MNGPDRVVIVGAGLAGVQTAMELRALGYEGEIVLVGEEALAYDRPPLSKDVLAGDARPPGLELLTAETAAEHNIDLRTGLRAAGIDRAGKRVRFEGGGSLAYDRLVLATGGVACAIPTLPPDRRRVFVVRDLEDSEALAAALLPGRRLLVVGAGWLGLEIAAAAAAKGLSVRLVEQAERVCARSVPTEVSAYLESLQAACGVDVRTGAPARVSLLPRGVGLDHGDSPIETFDLCVTAVGMRPRTDLAAVAGLPCADGAEADARGRTVDPAIYVVGDCAAWWNPAQGRHQRHESWHSARMQARIAAADIVGREPPCEAPWFWSDHAGKQIQAAGALDFRDRLIAHEAGDAPVWRYGAGEEATFVVGVNRARDMRAAHRGLSARAKALAASPEPAE